MTATRRQVDDKHYYVIDTYQFVEYATTIADIMLERDHGGPWQGGIKDDGVVSIANDVECGIGLIHLDPFKAFPDIIAAANWTNNMIQYVEDRNDHVRFEVGTEEAIKPYKINDLATFVAFLHPKLYKVDYIVVQTGAKIQGKSNADTLDPSKAKEMIDFCHANGAKAKEHNGDFLSDESIKHRFQLGLDAINIGPELGLLETDTVLNTVSPQDAEALTTLFVNSDKWKRWLLADSPESEKAEFAGHYLYSDPAFLRIKYKYPTLNHLITNRLIDKIKTRYEATLCEK